MGNGIKISGDWLVVVNPNAGSRKGEKDWPGISGMLDKNGFKYKAVFTQNRNHAINITSAGIADGYRNIIVVGGDGTLNEVVNGILYQSACEPGDISIGMIPVGTGNDWGRMYKLPKKYAKAIKVIKKGHLFTQDVGKVKYQDDTGDHERYFINVSGMGYDAMVALKTNRMKDRGKGGPFSYLINIFTGLFEYKNIHFDIEVDGKAVFSGKVLSMNLGICRYNGGGLMQVPTAIPDDGLLDVTVIKGISKFRIITNVVKLYDGSLIKLKFVDHYRCKTCRIVSRPAGIALLEADGESLGHSPLEFSVLHKVLKLIIPGDPELD
jgi:YegS/Rv2252/BmrU family lipid kinase